MAHPIINYNGEDITCYPGSNQQDEGKLNLEFNMARFVTRVSSKNFCIVKPSFVPSITSDISTGAPLIRLTKGQCSINGMDLIMENSITIGAPDGVGKWYLAFKLARDSSSNVLGDLVYGSIRTFKGVYLTYFDEKPDPVTDPDIFYLGSVYWDGTNFSQLEEDEDKYGRIWAEDILCKFLDPKHADIRRLNLQEWIYKVPDWYFSKEGDIVYGPVTIAESRNNPKNTGIIINVDDTGSYVTIKDPSVNNNLLQLYGDVNRDGKVDAEDLRIIQTYINGTATPSALQKVLADVNHDGVIDEKDLEYITNYINQDPKKNWGDTGNIYYIDDSKKDMNINVHNGSYVWNLGNASIFTTDSNNILNVYNNGKIFINAEGQLKLEGDDEIYISTENVNSPVLKLDNNNVSITDPDSDGNGLKFNFNFSDASTAKFTLGKAIWQYSNSSKNIVLLPTDVNFLKVDPNAIFLKNVNVFDTIYLGVDDNDSKSFIRTKEWQIANDVSNATITTNFKPGIIIETNNTADAAYYLTKNTNSTSYSKLFNSGKLDLYNASTSVNPTINFKDDNSSVDVRLYKTDNQKILNLDGALSTNNYITSTGLITGNGLKTSNGTLTFSLGNNDATIKKDSGNTNLKTSGDFYIGASGTSQLFAGNTTIKGTFTQGSNGQCAIDINGNIDTSGTITGARVYNAVYNDYAEVFEKSREEIIEPGDIVCIREDGLVHKVELMSDINSIVGICSNTEGVLLGGKDLDEDQKCIVGMVGKIWVKTNNPYLTPGQLVKALPNGTVDYTNNRQEKFGVVMSTVNEEGKVRIVYNG